MVPSVEAEAEEDQACSPGLVHLQAEDDPARDQL